LIPAPLELVASIDVPAAVEGHRFVLEALKSTHKLRDVSDDETQKVLGTANNKRAELYGWAANVVPHSDGFGYIYLAPLNDGVTTVFAECDGRTHSMRLMKGMIVRLDDRCTHWTYDDRTRVCAFVGAFKRPDDPTAVAVLTSCIAALAEGSYYDAPRVTPGFRSYGADECLVPLDDMSDVTPMILSDAIAGGRDYETCSVCGAPATALPRSWPYDLDSRCDRHK
jgi:hypothetical protein